jgi:hypothetical protein
MNNLWSLIQLEKTTEKRLVMAPDHDQIRSHHTCGSRDLLNRITGRKKRLTLRIDSPYLICQIGQTSFCVSPVLLQQPVYVFVPNSMEEGGA